MSNIEIMRLVNLVISFGSLIAGSITCLLLYKTFTKPKLEAKKEIRRQAKLMRYKGKVEKLTKHEKD